MRKLKVIVATDGSVGADIAGAVMKRLPFAKDTDFTVTMVTHLPAMAGLALESGSLVDGDQYATNEWHIKVNLARQITDRVAQRLRDSDFKADSLVLEGDTADELLALIKDQDADLVVAGCGTDSNFRAFFLGSVSRQLVLYSEASVLIGRPYAKDVEGGSFYTLRSKEKLDLFVAFDGSKGSDLAIETLANLTEPVFGTVHVLTVKPVLYVSHGADLPALLPSYESDKARMDKIAADAASRISRCADRVVPISSFGRPSVEICRLAEEKQADLILMGANRHGALKRLIVGSCAYETATSAPCSVMVLRDVLEFGQKSI